jgi:hypothetical protein
VNDGSVLTLWVIYFGASNHPPGKWVVRAQDVVPGMSEPRAHEIFHECGSLLEARCKVPDGLYRMDRDPRDDETIVEVWI